jgi:hypothetical protein
MLYIKEIQFVYFYFFIFVLILYVIFYCYTDEIMFLIINNIFNTFYLIYSNLFDLFFLKLKLSLLYSFLICFWYQIQINSILFFSSLTNFKYLMLKNLYFNVVKY